MSDMSNGSKRRPDVQGDFRRYPLPRLLYYLLKKKFTGQIQCRPPEINPGRIYFRDGQPVFTDLVFSQDYLGTILLQRGLITQQAYDQSLQELAGGKELHGRILVRQQALDGDKLVKGLRKQLYRKVIRLFPMVTTTFALYHGQHKRGTEGEEATLKADPYWLICHGIRNGFPQEIMETELKKLQDKLLKLPAHFGKVQKRYGMGADEQGILTLLAHSAVSLADVIRVSNMSPLESEMMVYALWTTEMLTVSAAKGTTAAPTAPTTQAAPLAPPPPPASQAVSAPAAGATGLDRVLTPPPPDLTQEQGGGIPMPPLTKAEKAMLSKNPALADTAEPTAPPPTSPVIPKPADSKPAPAPVDEDAPLPFDLEDNRQQSAFSQESQAAAEHRRLVKETFEQMQEKDHFQVLGVDREAKSGAVRDAYYQLAKQFHPDRCNQLGIRDVAPQSDEIFRRISEAHTVLSDPAEAKKYLEQLEGKTSKQEALSALEAEFVFQKGVFFFRKKDYRKAREHFKEAYRLNSKEGEHLAWMAWTDYNDPATKDSVEIRERVLQQLNESQEISPRNSQVYYFLGEYFAAQAKDKEAIKNFNECLEIKPDHMEAERHLRVIRMRLDKRKAAELKKQGGLFGLFRKKDKEEDKKKKKKKKTRW